MSRAKRKRIAAMHRKQFKRAEAAAFAVLTSPPVMAALTRYVFRVSSALVLRTEDFRNAAYRRREA